MLHIIINEWKIFLRDRVFIYSTAFFVFSLVITVFLGSLQNRKQKLYQEDAQKHVRKQWESLDAINPHSAAHYGSYAFKPLNVLNSMDSGINDITGNVIKLEGHVQNEIVYSEASQALSISKFGKLKSSLILQYVIPLFLIFFIFRNISLLLQHENTQFNQESFILFSVCPFVVSLFLCVCHIALCALRLSNLNCKVWLKMRMVISFTLMTKYFADIPSFSSNPAMLYR